VDVDSRAPDSGEADLQSVPPAEPRKRKTEFDNAAVQLGLQVDKTGASVVGVMQFTWKTSRLPKEFLPGHWEHTGGAQIVTPIHSPVVGKNIQAYYQITRADVWKKEDLTEKLGGSLDLWVQPFVQLPLDAGSPKNPSSVQAGANVGFTLQLEVKKNPDDTPTVKVFLQGQYGLTVGPHGIDHGAAAFAGVSFEFEPEDFFGHKKEKKKKPAVADGISVDPSTLIIKPGGREKITLTVVNTPQEAADVYFVGLPQGIATPWAAIGPYTNTKEIFLSADANAPEGESRVTIRCAPGNRVLTTQIRLVVKR
jgi:hypothetical protein